MSPCSNSPNPDIKTQHSSPIPPLTQAPAYHTTTIMHTKKILIILSDAHTFSLKKTSGNDAGKSFDHPTGVFLMELVKPLQKLLEAGHEITFASPKGQEPSIEPNSETLLAFAGNFYERQRENDLIDRMKRENGFSRPRPFSSFSDEELATFAGCLSPVDMRR